jgi:hypothetical protein
VFSEQWQRDDANTTKDDETAQADVGGVDGWVGALDGFQTAPQGNGYKTTGKVGTVWDGTQIAKRTEPSQVTKTNSVTHAYTRDEGSGPTYTIGVTINSEVSVSGSARQSNTNDPQWWWDTSSEISFLGVSARAFNENTEEWEDLESIVTPLVDWPSGGVNDGGAGAAGDAKDNTQLNQEEGYEFSVMNYVNAPPALTEQSNGWAYEPSNDTIKVTITATWRSKGRPASVDNADVLNERHELSFEMTTSIQ